MSNRSKVFFRKAAIFLLGLSAGLSFSGCAREAQSASVPAPTALFSEEVPVYWEPELKIERVSDTGAVIVFQQTEDLGNHLILSGNDYSLEVLTETGWEALPISQDHVNWVKDAFVVTAVPRDDIDWEWLYGSLPAGHYRICKPVSLQQGDRIIQQSMVYGEFTLGEAGQTGSQAAIPELPDISGIRYAPLESLGSGYSVEQAAQDQVVILQDGSARENQEIWYAFAAAAEAGECAAVRCMHTGISDSFPGVYDVSFDGLHYTIRWFEQGAERRISFKHMLCFPGNTQETPYPLVRYVLVTEPDVTWEDIQWGAVSESEIDDIAHRIVYQELGYGPEQLPIPESIRVTLSLRGQESFTATGEQALQLSSLFRQSKLMEEDPDIDYNGNDLIFQGSDGSQITLWLDNRGGIFLYNGYYYRYDTQAMLQYLGLTSLPW